MLIESSFYSLGISLAMGLFSFLRNICWLGQQEIKGNLVRSYLIKVFINFFIEFIVIIN